MAERQSRQRNRVLASWQSPDAPGDAAVGAGRITAHPQRGGSSIVSGHDLPRDPHGSGTQTALFSSISSADRGGAIGLTIALLVTRLLSGLLFGIDTIDPLTFVGVPLVLGATALLAVYLPARRASRINPVTALRTE